MTYLIRYVNIKSRKENKNGNKFKRNRLPRTTRTKNKMLPIFTTYNMTKSKVDQTNKEYQEAEKKIKEFIERKKKRLYDNAIKEMKLKLKRIDEDLEREEMLELQNIKEQLEKKILLDEILKKKD